MSFNLIDAAKGLFTNELVSKASSYLGESEGGISKAMVGIIPSLLGGIADKASSGDGAGTVANMARDSDNSGILGNLAGFMGGDEGGMLNKGSGMLNGLLGDSKAGMLTNLISKFSGVKSTTATSLLSMAAPALLGLLGKHAATNNLDAGGLSSFLSSQKSNISNAMPAGLDLGSVFSGFGGKAANMVSDAGHTSKHYTEEVGEKASGGMKMLLPILLLILAAAAAYYFFKDGCRKKVDATEVAATEDTSMNTVRENTETAMPSIKGKLDSVSGDFIYDMGENVSIDLPNNGGKLMVGKNSTEYKLVTFLNDKSAMLDTAKGNWFEFTNVRFKTGGSQITDASMEQLKNMAAISKAYPVAQFKIGGYTDNTGNAAANIALSQKRADAVAAMLKKLGVADAAIEKAKGYGQEWPLADNATAEGRAQNRRVAVNVKAK